jgi:ferrous iron transport protein B
VRRYALIGNPNAGKTTLFNELTGTSQHVGNWPGVTVEKKIGKVRDKYGDGQIIDLPGIYSLSSYSIEERVSRSYIIDEKPDVVIDIVEATNIERNLFLTTQIAELGVPLVVAINMMDEAEKEGDSIDMDRLSKELGLPVMPITAVKGEGVIELMKVVGASGLMDLVEKQAERPYHEGEDEHGHGFEDIEDPQQHRLEHHSDAEGRTNALIAEYKYHNHYKGPMVFQSIDGVALTQEQETENAEARYTFISKVVAASVTKGRAVGKRNTSDKLDRILTHPVFGIPLFLAIMWFMFHCTFSSDFLWLGIDSPGIWLQGLAKILVGWIADGASALLVPNSWVYSLVINGVIAGVGAVLSFLPQICVLFFFLTLLEDVGYMARAAFIMDRLLRVFGLSGKSFLPMLMGFGCSVPAMMACRTMENENDRKMTLFLVPFMSCGARAPIFLVLAGAFFTAYSDWVVFGLYLLGIVVAVLTGFVLKRVVFKGETTPLIIELPKYRAPRVKSLALALWKTIKDYVGRAGTIIFIMSIIIWFFANYGFGPQGFGMVNMQDSLLAVAGTAIAPIFSPLGFGFWTAAVALISGFVAKESVIGTMGVLYGVGEKEAIDGGALSQGVLANAGFTPLSALSFMVFSLLYLPCMAAFATLRRESNSWKWTFAQAGYSVAIAWLMAFIVYQGGSLMGLA